MFEIYFVSALLVATVVLFVTEKVPVDVTSIGIMVMLMVFGILTPEETVAGFSSPAPLTVGALFIVSHGLIRTGALNFLIDKIALISKGRSSALLLLSLGVCGLMSAFINNTPVVVMFVSIILAVCAKYSLHPSQYLIPVSYISILAGTSTLIGTSTNIIVSDVAAGMGYAEIGMFELSSLGAPIALGGALLLFLFSSKLLPKHKVPILEHAGGADSRYISELLVPEGSQLLGSGSVENIRAQFPDLEVFEVIREDGFCDAETDSCTIAPENIILVKASANDLIHLLEKKLVTLPTSNGVPLDNPASDKSMCVELVIPPNSPFIGMPLKETELHSDELVHVIGVQRMRHQYKARKMENMRMSVGDILLAQAPLDHFEPWRRRGELMVLEDVVHTIEYRTKAPLAGLIFLAMILTTAFGLTNILTASLAAAFLMMVTGCLKLSEAYGSVDSKVLIQIIGTISLGTALSKTGAADYYAGAFLSLFEGQGPQVILTAFIILTSLLSHFLSNNTTAVLLLPIGISAATALGVDVRPFIVGICFGASACYASPIGYQTNLLVFGPGGYSFRDYFKLGMVLNVFVWIMASALIPLIWHF